MIDVYEIVIENQKKKIKYGYNRNYCKKYPFKKGLWMEFTLDKASWSQSERLHHLPYVTDIATMRIRHRQVCHAQHLISADNIIVVDW